MNYIRIVKPVIFVFMLFIADYGIGKLLKYLYLTTNSPSIANLRYSIDDARQDILIYGSSRAESHYMPDTIKSRTGFSCYNGGVSGQGVIFSYIQISEILKHYTPKLILLDITPSTLLDVTYNDRLNVFKPYFGRDTIINNILSLNSTFEKYKYISSIYPYNGYILAFLKNLYSPVELSGNNGFIPLYGEIDTTAIKIGNFNSYSIPKSQQDYLQKIICLSKKQYVPLIIIISPIYKKNNTDNLIISQLSEICNQNTIKFFNLSDDLTISKSSNLFLDRHHMNYKGAIQYSIQISKVISSNIKN